MKVRTALAVLGSMLIALGMIAPAWAQVTNNAGNRTLSPGDTFQAGASSSSSSSSAAGATAISNPVQVNTQVNSQTSIQGQQQGQIQGQGQGQKQSANNEGINISTEIPAQAPAIFAPNLTSSPEACMGSVSAGGGAGFGGTSFGITFGTTWTNDQCQDRMNARTLGSLGQNQAALEYLAATNPKIATALKQAGVKVAANEPVIVVAAAPVAQQGGAKVEKKDVTQAVAELPACGDGKPSKLTARGFYTCAMYR